MKLLFVVYNNESHISWFPIGLGYLAAACLEAGHEVKVYQQDIYNWPESHLTDTLDQGDYDVVVVSVVAGYYQYRKLKSISRSINASKKRDQIKYLIGGHGPAADPEFFLKKMNADFVGIGEGENTIVELLDAIHSGSGYESVKGIAYFKDNQFIKTPRRPLIQNVDTIMRPAYELFDINYYALIRAPKTVANDRVMAVLSGRGCTFECNFCYRLDKGFRPRSAESIINEVEFLKNQYAINYIYFSDELLMSSVQRTRELCEAFIERNLNIKWWCNGRLNYADTELLELMKKAGCVFINYGIESLDDKTLHIMHKALTRDIIIKGIENTLEVGISPGLNIIYGNVDEPLEAIDDAVAFLAKYDDHAQLRTIRPVTPYPGTELFQIAVDRGLIESVEDFYENKHKNSDLFTVNFTQYSDEEVYEKLYEANKKLISMYIEHSKNKMDELCRSLYLDRDDSFRGFRQT